MLESPLANHLFDAVIRDLTASPPRRPVSTYRIQLHKGFTLSQLRKFVPYLDDLGIGDIYLSPYLDARPGSTHGYDVFDHSRINPEVGDDQEHARLVDDLRERGMGRVLDVVPNHMGVNGPNPYWLDVLEIGPHSPYAAFFDIDWHPVKDELEGRVLLPVLEDQYGKVLESGKLIVERIGGSFLLRYGESTLPLAPKSYAIVLAEAARASTARLGDENPQVLELLSIWASAESLPDRASNRPEDIAHSLREQKILPRRIARLCDESPEMCDSIDQAILRLHGEPGRPCSFDALHRLLEGQVYRLSSWKVASQEINYRRFFDVNDLAGLRTEEAQVYETVHAKVFAWMAEGGVSALRIDHPDGLADPAGYFRRLQESAFLLRCRARFVADGLAEADWFDTSVALRKRFRAESAASVSPLRRSFSIVAEKILSRGEDLPADWPIDGTVGYEYLNALNGLFIEPSAGDAINSIYAEFTGDREPFAEVLYRSKQSIAQISLASEINTLARQLNRVSEHDRRSRDFTLYDLQMAIREVVACFPVYRTYLEPGEAVSDRDRAVIEHAVARASRRVPALDSTLFEFLRSTLLLEPVDGLSAQGNLLREAFVRRFQQTTGPIQAKGLEDTAFYRQVPLASRNEVGADPARFASSPGIFHAMNAQRLELWPGSLSTTATHDTKRGEDVRVRIDAISEVADEWRARLARWSRCNTRRKTEIHGVPAPDGREEYLFYQALLGSWPFDGGVETVQKPFVDRMRDYMIKAIREAKVNTSWNDADTSYSEAVAHFVEETLNGPESATFLRDFLPFQQRIACIGVVNALSQTVLKLASPGVPDVYQGCEYWDFSLVDPDNRRPVDYDARISSLRLMDERMQGGMSRVALARELFANSHDPAIKQYVLSTILRHRRENHDLYAYGAYRPLDVTGEEKSRVIAFERSRNGRTVVAVAARLVAPLMGDEGLSSPIGVDVWKDTQLCFPGSPNQRRWRDLLTDRVVNRTEGGASSAAPIGEVFRILPVALLLAE